MPPICTMTYTLVVTRYSSLHSQVFMGAHRQLPWGSPSYRFPLQHNKRNNKKKCAFRLKNLSSKRFLKSVICYQHITLITATYIQKMNFSRGTCNTKRPFPWATKSRRCYCRTTYFYVLDDSVTYPLRWRNGIARSWRLPNDRCADPLPFST